MRDWREGVSESRGRMGERYTPELCMRGRGKTKKEPVDVEGGQRTSSSGIEVRKGGGRCASEMIVNILRISFHLFSMDRIRRLNRNLYKAHHVRRPSVVPRASEARNAEERLTLTRRRTPSPRSAASPSA